ncbi:MAG: hypothetical protein H0W83_04090 [Planctomycetes bacterium]|nr:hypothetical protein [Planctomycetota bacterium]
MSDQPQSYANHRRLHPIIHLVVLPLLLINLIVAVVMTVRAPALGTVWQAVIALALLLFGIAARDMVLKVQDRIIRLEMRLRLAQLLPADLAARIGQLQPGQLVALRFASDAELPELIRRTLDGGFASNDAIKRAITSWQGDHLRA